MSVLYASPDDLKSPLRAIGHTARNEPDVRNLLTAASRWIDGYFNLVEDAFAQPSTASRFFEVSQVRGGILRLDMPLLSLTTVTDGAGGNVDLDNLVLLPRNSLPAISLRLTAGLWMESGSEIEVTGYWGYSTIVPSPVREATALLAVWMVNEYQTRRGVEGATFDKAGEEASTQEVPALLHTLLLPIGNHLRRLRHS